MAVEQRMVGDETRRRVEQCLGVASLFGQRPVQSERVTNGRRRFVAGDRPRRNRGQEVGDAIDELMPERSETETRADVARRLDVGEEIDASDEGQW